LKETPLATHESALKRHRQSLKRRLRNKIVRSQMKSSMKTLSDAIDGKDKAAAKETLRSTTATIARTAAKGVIHKKTASRKISRLTKRVNSLA
jgi:small subunit ribosomal protein S20